MNRRILLRVLPHSIAKQLLYTRDNNSFVSNEKSLKKVSSIVDIIVLMLYICNIQIKIIITKNK